MKLEIIEEIELPQEVQAMRDGLFLIVKGPKGEVKRKMSHHNIEIKITGNKIVFHCKKSTKREKTAVYTLMAHLKNMIHGVQKPFVYKLKACSGPPASHFPMQITIANNTFTIKNFLGEKVPRILKLKQGVSVKINGTEITVESPDIEIAGATASELELATNIPNKDQRIFQDGIYIVEKPERDVAA